MGQPYTPYKQEIRRFQGMGDKWSPTQIINLTKALTGDLSSNDLRWECETQIEVISTPREMGTKKLEYLKELLQQL